MASPQTVLLALGAAALFAGSAAAAQDGGAPQPLKPIDKDAFFSGRWYEIGRTPMKITDGCVAGASDYAKGPDGGIVDRDSCRKGTPEGKEKVFAGPVTLLDANNAKFEVRYKVLGPITTTKTYWILDRGDEYRWFIVSDPKFENVSIFTRQADPSSDTVELLKTRVHQLGYDPAKLEFPTRFPAGEGRPAQ